MRYAFWLRTDSSMDLTTAAEHAVVAEEHGWDGVFVADSIWEGWSDPWTVLAAIASQTTRISLGTWVTPVPHRNPWWLAHTVAALDQLSNGRVILGCGLGAPFEYEMFGSPHDMKALGRKYDECLEIITGFWKGEPFDYEGEFFRINQAKLPHVPVQQPRVPILMGCWWPNKKPFRRAANYDGIMPFWPALLGDKGGEAWDTPGVGPQGEQRTGTLEEELRDLLAYYHSLVDDPGEIFLPDRADDEYRQICRDLGATWMFSLNVSTLEEIRRGPPAN